MGLPALRLIEKAIGVPLSKAKEEMAERPTLKETIPSLTR